MIRHRLGARMCAAIASACLAAPCPADPNADAAVERYLDRLGVTSIFAERLEHEFSRATGAERESIAVRLAGVYAEMLAEASADASVERWEARARALLDAAPDAATIELRLSLARAAYIRAEAAAERGILRIGSPEDARAAASRLSELIRELDRIADEAHRRVQSLEKREESATDRDTILLTAALSEGRRHRSIAHFLAGNSAVLVALATGSAESAETALIHFGWILGAKPGAKPELDRLADQNLLFPHVAKSALGAALAHALRGRADESAAWIAAVRSAPRLPPDITELITTREIQSLAAGGRWTELAALVASKRSAEGSTSEDWRPQLTTTQARLLAVLALGAPESAPRAPIAEVRDTAMGELVGRGELGHVLAIATAFGTQGFGTDSFIGLEVRGLKAYDDARTAHGPDDASRVDPPSDPAVRRMYAAAAELFELALRARGVDAFPDAAAQTMLLVGVCRINALGDDAPEDATDPEAWLVRAAEAIRDPARAAAALRLAIHALDQRVSTGGPDAKPAAARRDAMIDTFLDRFPTDAAAPSMIVRRATSPGFDPVRGLTMLLSVPASSPWHGPARHHAAALAFEIYRNAPVGEREWAARRYLDLEDPLLAADRRVATEGRRDAADRAALRARRIIEAALSLEVPDAVMADRALEVIDSLVALGLVDAGPIRAELAYRRAQLAIVRGDHIAADALLAEAADADPGLARAGDRLRYEGAVRQWRAFRRDARGSAEAIAAARRVADAAEALIDADPTALLGGPGAVVRSVGAEALTEVFAATGDRTSAERALVLLREVLDEAPHATAELRRLAELAEALGLLDESLAAWRTLIAGLPVGSDQWFDARVRHVSVLARSEPDRAREVLAQHIALYPEYGPEPWGPQLRAIHDTLGGKR